MPVSPPSHLHLPLKGACDLPRCMGPRGTASLYATRHTPFWFLAETLLCPPPSGLLTFFHPDPAPTLRPSLTQSWSWPSCWAQALCCSGSTWFCQMAPSGGITGARWRKGGALGDERWMLGSEWRYQPHRGGRRGLVNGSDRVVVASCSQPAKGDFLQSVTMRGEEEQCSILYLVVLDSPEQEVKGSQLNGKCEDSTIQLVYCIWDNRVKGLVKGVTFNSPLIQVVSAGRSFRCQSSAMNTL